MKNLFFCCMILCFLPMVVFGQEMPKISEVKDSVDNLRLSSVEVSSGKGAVTSGLYLYANLESKKAFLTTTLSMNDLEITYLYRLFKDKLLVGPNFGYFFNACYGGVQTIFCPNKYIETFHWVGWSIGKPDQKIVLKQSGFLFAINSVSLKLWRFKATYCLINYQKNAPQHTATLQYTQKINDKFNIYTNVGYDFLNENQLLQLGVKYKL